MIDLRCFSLLTLLLAQFDAPVPDPDARETRPPVVPEAAPTRGRERRIDPALLRALAAADPPVDALRAAASALALTEPERARSLVVRARLAGWLPEVRARVDRHFARAESVDVGASTAPLAPVGIDSDNDVRYELRATWDLSRIVFNPDELGAQFQALRTADARWFGVNTAVWDGNFDTATTISLLREMGTMLMRFPGGSLSDEYHWASNTTLCG